MAQTILIVEDDAGTLQLFATLVKRRLPEFQVFRAANVPETLTLFKDTLPDLILLDLALPQVNGIELLKTIRKTPRLQHIKVIAISAHHQLMHKARNHGVDDTLIKPARPNEIVALIREVLQNPVS